MPDYDLDPDGFREYQDRTLKPFGLAVGRVLATADNPRGNPDMIVERAGQDTLGISTFLARPFTGVVVYLEATSDDRLSFYAPERLDAPEARTLSDVRDPREPSRPTRSKPTRSYGFSTPAR